MVRWSGKVRLTRRRRTRRLHVGFTTKKKIHIYSL